MSSMQLNFLQVLIRSFLFLVANSIPVAGICHSLFYLKISFPLFIVIIMYVCVYAQCLCLCASTIVHVCRSEDRLQELGLITHAGLHRQGFSPLSQV